MRSRGDSRRTGGTLVAAGVGGTLVFVKFSCSDKSGGPCVTA